MIKVDFKYKFAIAYELKANKLNVSDNHEKHKLMAYNLLKIILICGIKYTICLNTIIFFLHFIINITLVHGSIQKITYCRISLNNLKYI